MEGSEYQSPQPDSGYVSSRASTLKRSHALVGASLLSSMQSSAPVEVISSSQEPLDDPMSGDEEEPSDELPDLDEYFNEFDVPIRDRISLCRSYASYLSARAPRKK